MALDHSIQPTARLGVRFAVQQGKAAVVVLPSAEGLRAAGSSQSRSSENWLAQFSAHSERLGQGSRVYAGRSEDSASARKHRHHLPGVRRTANGSQAGVATTLSELCKAESRAGGLETGERCLGRVPNDDDFGSITRVCDPYLTQMEIGDPAKTLMRDPTHG